MVFFIFLFFGDWFIFILFFLLSFVLVGDTAGEMFIVLSFVLVFWELLLMMGNGKLRMFEVFLYVLFALAALFVFVLLFVFVVLVMFVVVVVVVVGGGEDWFGIVLVFFFGDGIIFFLFLMFGWLFFEFLFGFELLIWILLFVVVIL